MTHSLSKLGIGRLQYKALNRLFFRQIEIDVQNKINIHYEKPTFKLLGKRGSGERLRTLDYLFDVKSIDQKG